jgi:hypothetical protein
MKIEVVYVVRRPAWPLWAVLIVLAWLALGAAVLWLGAYTGRPTEICLFKRLTGLACPTCGFTRGALCLLRGRPGRAWLYNPLLFSALALFFTDTASRLLSGRTVRIHLTQAERKFAWPVACVLLALNWIYVIFCIG